MRPHIFIKVNYANTNNYTHLLDGLKSNDPIHLLNCNEYDNPNDNYNTLHEYLMQLKDKHLPIKYVKFNRHKHKKAKWITKGLIESIKYRDRLYRDLHTTLSTSDAFQRKKTNLATYNGILKKAIRNAKLNYYNSQFNQNKNNMKSTWKLISEIICKQNKSDKVKKIFSWKVNY